VLLGCFVLIRSGFGAGLEEVGLTNAGFENDPVLEGWELSVYGARPEVVPDPTEWHSGKRSLRIRAEESSDTALGREIALKPGRWYRFSAWVKTEQMVPQTAPVFGTLQVQRPGGRGTIASGENHGGTMAWSETRVMFRAPADGRVRLCLFFVGFGKGTGTVWFDDLRLEEIEPGNETLRITRDQLGEDPISPLQYGQFIEYLCNLVPGMWAEKLYNGSFEGLSPYQFEFIKETDFQEKPWYPSGEVSRGRFSPDRSTKINGEVSKRIDEEPGAPCRVGISQDGISVRLGAPCDFSSWFQAEGPARKVRVRLHHGQSEYAAAEFEPSPSWRKFSARLKPSGSDDNATLSIELDGPGVLWLDNASLMPVDNIGGWRRDVVDAVRALRPGVIRFGGSAVDEPSMGNFEWKDTVGEPDRRRPFRAWGGLQPTGPGLEEIVQFCRLVGAEPLICVRVRDRNPKDAAEEVEYFNGNTNSPMGSWRARNGHPEPYGILYWQVGNELGGADYERRLPAFCQAMKAADPGIKLLSSFPTPSLVRDSGEWLDYVCPHHYSQDLAWMENDLAGIGRMLREQATGRPIKVAVTEWNTTAGDAGPRRAMLWTLANALACSRYHNLLHRHADLVKIANRSNLANSFCSGIIQTDNHRLFKTPTYFAQQLYSTLAGNRPLKVESELPPNLAVDISVTLSADGKELTLFGVNDGEEAITRRLDLSAFGRRLPRAEVWALTDRQGAGDPDVFNSFDVPGRIAPVRSGFRAPQACFEYRFPALSLTVLKWRIGGRG
jgi:alpha-L-arabinofuranosidase